MGGELLDGQGVHETDDRIKPEDDQDVRQDGRPKEEEDEKTTGVKNLVEVLSRTASHYFPKFNEWLKQLTDIRNQDLITYHRETILWAALMAMITKRQSRMNISHQMREDQICRNLKELCGQENLEEVPHGDTVEYLMTRLKVEELEGVQVKMMAALLRGRVLERYRLLGKYHTIAIDGCHIHSFDYEHCEQCLVQKDKATGEKRWFHAKLMANLVTPTGLCLSMACEWIENEANYNKQDCELRAFYRLVKKLRLFYPKLPICLLLDALYAGQPTFDCLKKERMEGIVVFKEGSMPEAYQWVEKMKKECGLENTVIKEEEQEVEDRHQRSHEERMIRGQSKNQTRMIKTETTYTWMSQVEHWDGQRKFNVLGCREIVDGKKQCDYLWLVSDGLNLNEDTIETLAQRGRCRWKIENEGINTQKNGGYRLEHLYSRDKVSMKIWCAILDIAHLISQLIEQGSLIVLKTYGSIRNMSQRMFEHLRYYVFRKPPNPPRIQIRLRWNTS